MPLHNARGPGFAFATAMHLLGTQPPVRWLAMISTTLCSMKPSGRSLRSWALVTLYDAVAYYKKGSVEIKRFQGYIYCLDQAKDSERPRPVVTPIE